MAFEVYVYYVPRAKPAHVQVLGSAPQDDTLVIATGDTVTWKQPSTFVPWPVTVQFSGALPEATAGPEFTDIHTPASWSYRPFRRAWQPRPVFTAPPGDDSVAPTPEYSQGRTNRDDFRNPYNALSAIRFAINSPAYDDSLAANTTADALGGIIRNLHRKDYRAVLYIGAGALDDSLELDNTATTVRRPPFRNPYKPQRALDYAFNISYDDTTAVAAQPDQQGTVVRRIFRQTFDSRRAAVMLSGTAAYDDSLVIGAQPEAVGSIPRNLHQTRYNPKAAIVRLSGIEAHDDSTAVAELTGGVYIPSIRRRRR